MSNGLPLAVYRPASYSQQSPMGQCQQCDLQKAGAENVEASTDIGRLKWKAFAQFNNFRANIAILNTQPVRNLMDYLESTVGKGQAGNGRFGTLGLKMLANLNVNDPRWEQQKVQVPRDFRKSIKEAAHEVDYSPDLLKQITGDDWIFEPDDMANWLTQNPHRANVSDTTLETTERKYQEFRGAIEALSSDKATAVMDYLEQFHGGKSKIPEYGRFGLYAMKLLATLSPWSQEWDKVGVHDVYGKQILIDAASYALDPSNAQWLFQAHNGDGIFEKGEIDNWLRTNGVLRLKG